MRWTWILLLALAASGCSGPGPSPGEPFHLRVVVVDGLGGGPAAGVPVEVRVEGGATSEAVTGADGAASFTLGRMGIASLHAASDAWTRERIGRVGLGTPSDRDCTALCFDHHVFDLWLPGAEGEARLVVYPATLQREAPLRLDPPRADPLEGESWRPAPLVLSPDAATQAALMARLARVEATFAWASAPSRQADLRLAMDCAPDRGPTMRSDARPMPTDERVSAAWDFDLGTGEGCPVLHLGPLVGRLNSVEEGTLRVAYAFRAPA